MRMRTQFRLARCLTRPLNLLGLISGTCAVAAAPSVHADEQSVAALGAQLADARAKIVELESKLGTLAADVEALKTRQSAELKAEQGSANAPRPNAGEQTKDVESAWHGQ